MIARKQNQYESASHELVDMSLAFVLDLAQKPVGIYPATNLFPFPVISGDVVLVMPEADNDFNRILFDHTEYGMCTVQVVTQSDGTLTLNYYYATKQEKDFAQFYADYQAGNVLVAPRVSNQDWNSVRNNEAELAKLEAYEQTFRYVIHDADTELIYTVNQDGTVVELTPITGGEVLTISAADLSRLTRANVNNRLTLSYVFVENSLGQQIRLSGLEFDATDSGNIHRLCVAAFAQFSSHAEEMAPVAEVGRIDTLAQHLQNYPPANLAELQSFLAENILDQITHPRQVQHVMEVVTSWCSAHVFNTERHGNTNQIEFIKLLAALMQKLEAIGYEDNYEAATTCVQIYWSWIENLLHRSVVYMIDTNADFTAIAETLNQVNVHNLPHVPSQAGELLVNRFASYVNYLLKLIERGEYDLIKFGKALAQVVNTLSQFSGLSQNSLLERWQQLAELLGSKKTEKNRQKLNETINTLRTGGEITVAVANYATTSRDVHRLITALYNWTNLTVDPGMRIKRLKKLSTIVGKLVELAKTSPLLCDEVDDIAAFQNVDGLLEQAKQELEDLKPKRPAPVRASTLPKVVIAGLDREQENPVPVREPVMTLTVTTAATAEVEKPADEESDQAAETAVETTRETESTPEATESVFAEDDAVEAETLTVQTIIADFKLGKEFTAAQAQERDIVQEIKELGDIDSKDLMDLFIEILKWVNVYSRDEEDQSDRFLLYKDITKAIILPMAKQLNYKLVLDKINSSPGFSRPFGGKGKGGGYKGNKK